MNLFVPLIKLTENDKRVIIALCLILLLLIVIFGYIQKLVAHIMRKQGMKVDKMMYDIMRARVITSEKTFAKEASYKSHVYFVKKSWIPGLITTCFALALVLYAYFMHEFNFSFYTKAFKDICFELDWPYAPFFGMNLPCDWPTVVSSPDWSWSVDKYLSIFLTLGLVIAGTFFLVEVQALIARRMRIHKLRRTYFEKNINKLNPHKNENEGSTVNE